MDLILMTHKELEQIEVFERLLRRELTQEQAGQLLGLQGTRQVRRKLVAFKLHGPKSLIHKSRGQPSNHRLSESLKAQAVALVKEKYADFGPSFAAEKLYEREGLRINHETLRRLLTNAGVWHPKQKKQGDVHVWRERKACRGELVQLDGSHHAWFEDRAPTCCLLGFVDDATSEVWLEFASSESTESLMTATKHYLEANGRPVSFYADRGGVFKVNIHNGEGDKKTQYERACAEMGISFIHARSPQAKGRVERSFNTHQDRLVKELRLTGISTIAEANRFLKEEYLLAHNRRFAVASKETGDLHRSLDGFSLAEIFCLKSERVLQSDFCLSYKRRFLQLDKKQYRILMKGDSIQVSEYLDGRVALFKRGTLLGFTELPERPSKPLRLLQPIRLTTPTKPTAKAGTRAFLFT